MTHDSHFTADVNCKCQCGSDSEEVDTLFSTSVRKNVCHLVRHGILNNECQLKLPQVSRVPNSYRNPIFFITKAVCICQL